MLRPGKCEKRPVCLCRPGSNQGLNDSAQLERTGLIIGTSVGDIIRRESQLALFDVMGHLRHRVRIPKLMRSVGKQAPVSNCFCRPESENQLLRDGTIAQ